jgi:hypothetical protein
MYKQQREEIHGGENVSEDRDKLTWISCEYNQLH